MLKLENKPNVEAPSGTYPFGRVKDNSGANDGTPVNRLVYGDMHQFFEKLMNYASITPNDLPDNDSNGYQLHEAFVEGAKIANKALLGMLAETIIGNPDSIGTTTSPAALLGVEWNAAATDLAPGYIYWNDELFFCTGYVGAIVDTAVFTKASSNVINVTDATSGSGDFDYADLVFAQGKWRTYTPTLSANDGGSTIPGGFTGTAVGKWMFKNNTLHIRMGVSAVATLNTVKFLGFSLPMGVSSPYIAEGFNVCKYYNGAAYTTKQVKIGLRHTGSGTGLEVSSYDAGFFGSDSGGTLDFEITIGFRKDGE